ncbi:MAG: aldehyde dehydrogenase family protein [Candidatus Dormibacteria bacterium]
MTMRLEVRKTYKMYINGAFVRSESGRSYRPEGNADMNLPLGSRKDLRDAVRAARQAQTKWAALTAMNRGQILYRIAEMIDARRDEFHSILGGKPRHAQEVDDTVTTFVWYAGWADKFHAVLGTVDPVAGPYFTFTLPEPTGVVGIVSPSSQPLLGCARHLAPVLVTGNTSVLLAGDSDTRSQLLMGEILATSDVPQGVANILTGSVSELLPWLSAHMDVNAIDLSGCPAHLRADAERNAAENVKRVYRFEPIAPLSPYVMAESLEAKTVWHPLAR